MGQERHENAPRGWPGACVDWVRTPTGMPVGVISPDCSGRFRRTPSPRSWWRNPTFFPTNFIAILFWQPARPPYSRVVSHFQNRPTFPESTYNSRINVHFQNQPTFPESTNKIGIGSLLTLKCARDYKFP